MSLALTFEYWPNLKLKSYLTYDVYLTRPYSSFKTILVQCIYVKSLEYISEVNIL